ncbi:NYN domain-containing protein [Desulfovibrio sp. Huiquan2017]|uniref:NYN domain-containing protein n=1 Tax=Desulfovibrio sp. Huiquan2017 TaxID=2816861 RepID=UPI001A923AD3|nr:NYN domain-containing protein [Desulfovibrio sp. Huiquan2017]
MSSPNVYLFWDNSNIFISAKHVAARQEGLNAENFVRIHFENLYRLAIANRPVAKAIAVGSIPREHEKLWQSLKRDTGIEIELYERGSISGGEQGVDQCLQTHMLRAIADEQSPQIAVLLTGDGKGYDDGVGFHADLERMHKNQWGIEVVSWELSCKRTLREWASSIGEFVRLEDYYNAVTFLEGTRYSTPLNLVRRKCAHITEIKRERAPEQELIALKKQIKKLKYGQKINNKASRSNKKKRKRGF